ncbi:MAG: hypothetical protein Q7V63_09455 [Gammaproteobacteria bacterium]|nr:hypothetical protein [Gammaproteobacteria bacterium]
MAIFIVSALQDPKEMNGLKEAVVCGLAECDYSTQLSDFLTMFDTARSDNKSYIIKVGMAVLLAEHYSKEACGMIEARLNDIIQVLALAVQEFVYYENESVIDSRAAHALLNLAYKVPATLPIIMRNVDERCEIMSAENCVGEARQYMQVFPSGLYESLKQLYQLYLTTSSALASSAATCGAGTVLTFAGGLAAGAAASRASAIDVGRRT